MGVFLGHLHTPGWTADKDAIAQAQDVQKPSGMGKNKENIVRKKDWRKFQKSHLVNTYIVGGKGPPWSQPWPEKTFKAKFAYRNASKGSCNLGCGASGFTKKQRIKHEEEVRSWPMPRTVLARKVGCQCHGPTYVSSRRNAHIEIFRARPVAPPPA